MSTLTQPALAQDQEKAARVLQSRFRQYHREREQRGLNISSSARWSEVCKVQQRKSLQQQASPDGKNDPASRWHRGGFFAARLAESPTALSQHSSSHQHDAPMRRTKTMDIRYWLEMVDQKHRYGSNLKDYHVYWNTHYDGDQNFFYWLDHGEGRELDLEESPRERLEAEQIIYLNIDQRLNYLVHITPEGKLAWAKDGRPVDTARGKHRDLGHGLGITDLTQEELDEAQARGEIPTASDSSSAFTSCSSVSEEAHHYTQGPRSPNLRTRIKRRFDPKAIMDVLLRKTLNANTWIFVADNHGHLYVGLKQTGKFQHSSFLCGSEVLAAGLLRVNQGQLTSLSPLSGHYRAGSEQFKEFLDVLGNEWGCDMSKVLLSKSLMMIRALETYGEFSKRKQNVKTKIMHKLHVSHRTKKEDAKKTKEAEDDLPAQLAAQRLRDRQERDDMRKTAQLANQAGMTERQNIANVVGQGRKLSPTTNLPALPYEGMTKEEMSEHQRIERGAALIVRAMLRPMKVSED